MIRDYVPGAESSVEKYGGRFLVPGSVPTVAEGDWPEGRLLVVIEFPDMAHLKSWSDSPEYAASRQAARTALRRDLLFAAGPLLADGE